MSTNTPKLAALTKNKGNRTQGIQGAVSKKPKAPKTTPAPQSDVAALALEVSSSGGEESTDAEIQAIAVYVQADLAQWVRAQAKSRHMTLAQIVLEAIDLSYEALAARSPQTPKRTSLFATDTKTAPRRRDGKPRTQIFIRITKHNAAILDDLVERLGTGNKSALIEDALLEVQKDPQ